MENNLNENRIFVIGGGASGLASAYFAAKSGARVTVLESNSRPAEKILITGGGRCNFTNLEMSPEKYSNSSFVKHILDEFGAYDALDFFREIGIMPIMYEGYAYPRSEEAKTVADALIKACENKGVKIHNNAKVIDIKKINNKFKIYCETYTYEADKVIICCGGKSYPKTGSDGSGFELSKSLGHKITELYPVLTGLITDSSIVKAAGTRVRARVDLYINNVFCSSEKGEIQINNYGLSGIPVMNLSGYASKALNSGKSVSIKLDFAPEYETYDVINAYNDNASYTSFVPNSLAKILENIGNDKDSFVLNLKSFYINISGACNYNISHVTGGGIDTSYINPVTLESKIVDNLYFAGEILDNHGKCGGYNLHFAWASGAVAGTYAASGDSYISSPIDDEILKMFNASEIKGRRS